MVFVFIAIGLAFLNLVVFGAASRYRIDIRADQHPFEGSSWIPQVNYLNPDNYSPQGKRWVWTLICLQLLFACSVFAAVFQ